MTKHFFKALVIYIGVEILLYKLTGIYFAVVRGEAFEYQNWAYYFYFPEKKIKFYFFLIFLFSSWIYWSIFNFYLSYKRRMGNV